MMMDDLNRRHMPIRTLRLIALMCALASSPAAAEPAAAPVEVMILGVYHMANPGNDVHNMKADDVLVPKRQAEIAAVTTALARFKPDKVAVEWPAAIVASLYPRYLAGTLPPIINEVVQLGFRLAKTAGAKGVYGIDAAGDFPYQQVKSFADVHGFAGVLETNDAQAERDIAEKERILAEKGVSALLQRMNDPAYLRGDNASYRVLLRIGAGKDQPGVDLLSAWYRRNFLICANLLQLAQPGDRIVVLFGGGHAFLLRQCVAETPGLTLIEPNDYLPK
jgi:Family of unknown function (DUF5694)